MNPNVTTWERQLARIKNILKGAGDAKDDPRWRRGRKQRAKITPDRPADAPDLGQEPREHEEAERQARDDPDQTMRNPYDYHFPV